jgi:hypothetical protein
MSDGALVISTGASVTTGVGAGEIVSGRPSLARHMSSVANSVHVNSHAPGKHSLPGVCTRARSPATAHSFVTKPGSMYANAVVKFDVWSINTDAGISPSMKHERTKSISLRKVTNIAVCEAKQFV